MDKKHNIFSFFAKKENYEKVLEICYYLFRDEDAAKDATQEVFLKLVDVSEIINFPDNQREALLYVKRVVRNYFFEILRKNKYQGISLNGTKPEFIDVAEESRKNSSIQKLDLLNNLIKKKSHFFTHDQLQLWQCMYKCQTIEEIEKNLGKEKQTIYSLRNKLKDKIRKHVSLEELVN
jgi:RNA polymerase sigma factor (sigma-70 family)